MNIIDKITISRFHQDRTTGFGPGSVKSLGWQDKTVQNKRFTVLSSIADLNGHSVLDAGCGHGDLFAFLINKYPGCQYTGIDQVAPFLDIALQRYGNENAANFLLGDFTGSSLCSTDYVLCSGSLNYRSSDPGFIEHTISNLFGSCRYGLGFNLLSKVKDTAGILVAYDPEVILSICKKITPSVEYHAHYLRDDFTIFLYH